MLDGLISRDRWVRLPHPLRPGSSAGEHRLDMAGAAGSIPARGTRMARWTNGESRLPFKQDTLRVRVPSALLIPVSGNGSPAAR